MLGGAVGDGMSRSGFARDRGDVDDVTGASRDESLQRQPGAEDDSVKVDVDHRQGGRVRLVDERADGHDARVVDQHVEGPERVVYALEEPLKALPVGDVK